MADKKISALTAASTPLAGTEVLPIVQSSATVKVASNDLTVKNIRSNATTGILQIAGPAASSTRTMTVPDANFTAARTDAANSFTADQTLATGNLIQGTAAKGVNFTANTPSSTGTMTSQLLNWYEEGTFTPTVKGLTTAGTGTYVENGQIGRYTRIGNRVLYNIWLNWTAHTGTGDMAIGGLPYTSNSLVTNFSSASIGYLYEVALPANSIATAYVNSNSNDIYLSSYPYGGGAATAVTLDTSGRIMLSGQYEV